MQGYLLKRSDWRGNWNRRWCVLKPRARRLYYFLGDDDHEERGSFFLKGASVALDARKGTLTVKCPNRYPLVLRPADLDTREGLVIAKKWRDALSAATRGQDRTAASGPSSSLPPPNGAAARRNGNHAVVNRNGGEHKGDSVANGRRGAATTAAAEAAAAASTSSSPTPQPVAVRTGGPIPPPADVAVGGQYAELLKRELPKVIHKLRSDDPWVVSSNGKDLKTYTPKTKDPKFAQAKGVAEIPVPPRLLYEFLNDKKKKKLYDKLHDMARVVEQYDAQSDVAYSRSVGVWPTTARDMCLFRHWRVLPDGAVLIFVMSIVHPKVPKERKFVRATAGPGAYLLVPIRGGRATRIHFVMAVNLGGSVPKSIVDMVCARKTQVLLKLKTLLTAPDMAARRAERKPRMTNFWDAAGGISAAGKSNHPQAGPAGAAAASTGSGAASVVDAKDTASASSGRASAAARVSRKPELVSLVVDRWWLGREEDVTPSSVLGWDSPVAIGAVEPQANLVLTLHLEPGHAIGADIRNFARRRKAQWAWDKAMAAGNMMQKKSKTSGAAGAASGSGRDLVRRVMEQERGQQQQRGRGRGAQAQTKTTLTAVLPMDTAFWAGKEQREKWISVREVGLPISSSSSSSPGSSGGGDGTMEGMYHPQVRVRMQHYSDVDRTGLMRCMCQAKDRATGLARRLVLALVAALSLYLVVSLGPGLVAGAFSCRHEARSDGGSIATVLRYCGASLVGDAMQRLGNVLQMCARVARGVPTYALELGGAVRGGISAGASIARSGVGSITGVVSHRPIATAIILAALGVLTWFLQRRATQQADALRRQGFVLTILDFRANRNTEGSSSGGSGGSSPPRMRASSARGSPSAAVPASTAGSSSSSSSSSDAEGQSSLSSSSSSTEAAAAATGTSLAQAVNDAFEKECGKPAPIAPARFATAAEAAVRRVQELASMDKTETGTETEENAGEGTTTATRPGQEVAEAAWMLRDTREGISRWVRRPRSRYGSTIAWRGHAFVPHPVHAVAALVNLTWGGSSSSSSTTAGVRDGRAEARAEADLRATKLKLELDPDAAGGRRLAWVTASSSAPATVSATATATATAPTPKEREQEEKKTSGSRNAFEYAAASSTSTSTTTTPTCTHLEHETQKPIAGCRPRDLVLLTHTRVVSRTETSGVVVTASTSVEVDDIPPDPTGKVVRATCEARGWVLRAAKRASDGAVGTDVTCVACIDPGRAPRGSGEREGGAGEKVSEAAIKQMASNAVLRIKALKAELDRTAKAIRAAPPPRLTNRTTAAATANGENGAAAESGGKQVEAKPPAPVGPCAPPADLVLGGQFADLLKGTIPGLERRLRSNAAWVVSSNGKDLKTYTPKTKDPKFAQAKGVAEIPVPPRLIFEYLRDKTKKKLYDNLHDMDRIVDQLDAQSAVVYSRSIGVWPTTARDMCLFRHWRVLPDGAILLCIQSVSHPEVPKERKFVRATAGPGAYLLVPIRGGRATRMHFVMAVNLGGSVPKSIVDMVCARKTQVLLKLKTLLTAPDMAARRAEIKAPLKNFWDT